jgi:hypothetical protein
MEAMRTKNELSVAVGNTSVNARGDQIKGGRIVKPRDRVVSEYYDTNPNAVPRQSPAENKVEAEPNPVVVKRAKPAIKSTPDNSVETKTTEEKNVS